MDGSNMNSNPALSQGSADDGITQRCVHELFAKINYAKQQDKNRHFMISVSFLQIYNEKVYDLLNTQSVGSIS